MKLNWGLIGLLGIFLIGVLMQTSQGTTWGTGPIDNCAQGQGISCNVTTSSIISSAKTYYFDNIIINSGVTITINASHVWFNTSYTTVSDGYLNISGTINCIGYSATSKNGANGGSGGGGGAGWTNTNVAGTGGTNGANGNAGTGSGPGTGGAGSGSAVYAGSSGTGGIGGTTIATSGAGGSAGSGGGGGAGCTSNTGGGGGGGFYAGGGGGAGSTSTDYGGGAGGSGYSIKLTSNSVYLLSGGNINCNGEVGIVSGTYGGGGGGGGGGEIIINSTTFNTTSANQLNTKGGNGNGAYGHGSGGGGGGGHIAVYYHTNQTSNINTFNVSGGAVGTGGCTSTAGSLGVVSWTSQDAFPLNPIPSTGDSYSYGDPLYCSIPPFVPSVQSIGIMCMPRLNTTGQPYTGATVTCKVWTSPYFAAQVQAVQTCSEQGSTGMYNCTFLASNQTANTCYLINCSTAINGVTNQFAGTTCIMQNNLATSTNVTNILNNITTLSTQISTDVNTTKSNTATLLTNANQISTNVNATATSTQANQISTDVNTTKTNTNTIITNITTLSTNMSNNFTATNNLISTGWGYENRTDEIAQWIWQCVISSQSCYDAADGLVNLIWGDPTRSVQMGNPEEVAPYVWLDEYSGERTTNCTNCEVNITVNNTNTTNNYNSTEIINNSYPVNIIVNNTNSTINNSVYLQTQLDNATMKRVSREVAFYLPDYQAQYNALDNFNHPILFGYALPFPYITIIILAVFFIICTIAGVSFGLWFKKKIGLDRRFK